MQKPLAHLVAVMAALAVVACEGGGESASIGFGTGGADCDLGRAGSTFPVGSTVRVVARFDPTPGSVTISATRDGSPLHEPETVDLDESAPCIYGEVPDADPGHYEYIVTNPESKMQPLTGGFEVTSP